MQVEGGKGRVGVVGTGMVGSSFAYALMQSGLASEIVLVDRDVGRAEGEAMDLSHGAAFLRPVRITAGGFESLAGCDLVVLCAGANQRAGETRLDLLQRNMVVFREIVPKVVAVAPGAILLVATNPVDILTQVTADLSGAAPGRVLGSGTTLDTARFRAYLGEWFEIDPRSVHAWIVAEHGDTAVPVWSRANVAGVPLRDFVGPTGHAFDKRTMQAIFARTRDAAYEIIKRKGSTYYAIGIALLAVVEAVLRNQRTVLTVCSPLTGQHGISGMALSLPTIVGRGGAEEVIAIPLDAAEEAAFRRSADVLKERLAAVQ
jgi:L-lactate dehydrogenase